MMEPNPQKSHSLEATFWEHFAELRRYVFIAFLTFVFLAVVSDQFLYARVLPLITEALDGRALIFLSVLDPVIFRLKVDALIAICIEIPFIVFLVWRFVQSAVGIAHRRVLLLLLLFSLIFSYSAALFALLFLVPLTLHFLLSISVPSTTLLLTASQYLSFVMLEMALAALIVHIPVLMVLLAYVGIVSPHFFAAQRRYVYVGLAVILAILTPTTDIISLGLVFIPSVLMFELGLVLARMCSRV